MFARETTMQKLVLLASVLAGASFWLVAGRPHDAGLIAWKGAGVGLLALWALLHARQPWAAWIAVVMALGAIGDMLLELDRIAGAAFFAMGHIAAILLYLRNRRPQPVPSQRAAAAALLVGTPLAAWLLSHDLPTCGYALVLGAMAATAWLSNFSRYRVGVGALLFVVSDLLIFARTGPLAHSAVPGLLIWPLYYLGQLMICAGVIWPRRAVLSAA